MTDEGVGFYMHEPGRLSTGAVLDVGLKCTHSCRFCYYSYLDKSDDQFRGMRAASFRSLAECKSILDRLKANGFTHFDYTGGEPTLHPDIIEITRYAHRELGLRGRMITLGQFLMKKTRGCAQDALIKDLLDAGLVNFLFSFHAADESLFRDLTGESFERLRRAMSFLDERGFDYTSNTTVVEHNYRHLPDLAREVVKHRIYLHNFIIMNAYYEWNEDGGAFGVQAKYSDIRPHLEEAVSILESNGVGVNIRYAPLCAVKGLEKNLVGVVGVRYDPYEWMNAAGHLGGTPESCAAVLPVRPGGIEEHLVPRRLDLTLDNGVKVVGARGDFKHFVEKCAGCSAKDVCDGIDPHYLKSYGDGEFVPYRAQAEKAPLQRARYGYAPSFFVKTAPAAAMKKIVAAEFAREGGRRPDERARPAVSVIVPCYNYGRYLAEAVNSVLEQTYRDFEIVIVDDGSDDDTQSVARRLIAENPRSRIRLISRAHGGQPALSRNRGILEAEGRYILPLDADDVIAPTMLAECAALLDREPDVAIAYTDRLDFGDAEGVVQAGDYDFRRLRRENHISYCAMFRRDVWTRLGGYRANIRGCEDWDFWVAAGARGFYGRRIPKPLFKYRRHDGGVYREVLADFERKRAIVRRNNPEAYPSGCFGSARDWRLAARSALVAFKTRVKRFIPLRRGR